MKKIKAIKIDVQKEDVYEMEIGCDYKELYPAIGNNCTMFTCPFEYPNGDGLFCDDEILLRQEDMVGAFKYPDWDVPIVNNAVILGVDDEGDSVDVKSTVEEIKKDLKFINIDQLLRFQY